jgi:hypothetical protein
VFSLGFSLGNFRSAASHVIRRGRSHRSGAS